MSPAAFVVFEVLLQDPMQTSTTNNDDVVYALASDRVDEAFDIGILPGSWMR